MNANNYLNPIFLNLLSVLCLSACGGTFEDARLYGTWVIPLDNTEVTFYETGELDWGAESGRFEWVRSTNFAVCWSRGGCDDGQVKITVEGRSFRTSIYKSNFDSNPNTLSIYPRTFSGVPTTLEINDRSVNRVRLFREGSFSGSLMPEGYVLLNKGLSDKDYYSMYLDEIVQVPSGDLVGRVAGQLYRFSAEDDRWTLLDDDSWGYKLDPKTGLVLDHDPGNDRASRVSRDAGLTWRDLPEFSHPAYYDDILNGQYFIKLVARFDESSDSYKNIQLYALDLYDPQARWLPIGRVPSERIEGFNNDDWQGGMLVYETDYQTGESLISVDRAQSWHPFNDLCLTEKVFDVGSFMCGSDDETLLRFDYETLAYQTFDIGVPVSRNSLLPNVPRDGTVYLRVGDSVVQYSLDGALLMNVPLSDNIDGSFGDIQVLADRVIVAKSSLWSYLR